MFTFDESKKLGSGTFGTVFSGILNGLPVAVKKVGLRRNSRASLESLETEVNIQEELKHENIVTLFTSRLQDNYFYLVLELMGPDLFALLYTKNITLDSSTCVTIAKNIVAGLDYLHDQGILHRDIKPENILFNDRMQAKIADFGNATKQINETTFDLVGTKYYITPELALSIIHRDIEYTYNISTDIYALGITLLEMTLGDAPYGETADELPWKHIAVGNHRKIPRESHPILADVISSCLTINPDDRIDTKGIIQLLSILLLDAGAMIPPAVSGNSHVIHLAAKNGCLNIIKKLIERNPELVDVKDENNQTALLWAASRGHDDIVAFLISQGADVNVPTQLLAKNSDQKDHNISPLDWALKGGHAGCISILMMEGAIANHMPSMIKGKKLYEIIQEGNLTLVQMILQCNPAFLNQTNEKGLTLLHYAAQCGQIKIVRYLLAMGVDVNIAAVNVEIKGIKYPEMTALEMGLKIQQHDSIFILLLDAGARISPAVNGNTHAIHLAARNGRLDIIKKLIERNPELVHVKDENNQTALLWAASRGYDDIVAFLISQGADVNVASKLSDGQNNNSPLDWAIKGGHTGCISILMMADAIANNQIAKYNIELTNNKHLFFNNSKKTTHVTVNSIASSLELR